MVTYPKIIFLIFSQNVAFFEKIVRWKNIQNLVFHKKGLFIFVARRSLPFKRDLGSGNGFLLFSQKIQIFLEKLLNNKIFRTWFVIRNVILIFGKTPLFAKKSSNVPPKKFFTVFSENTVFFKKMLNKKYSATNFWWKRLYSDSV